MSVISIVPYTVFRVKLENQKNSPEILSNESLGYQTIYNSIISGSRVGLGSYNNIDLVWANKSYDILDYSSRKNVFLKKSQLFESFIFKLTDLTYLNIFSKTYNNSNKYMQSFKVSRFISQVN
jgi:hypothetical protein